MNKENCTKVPVRVEPFLGKGGGLSVCVTTASEKNIVATIHKDRSGHWSDGMDAANAELIAEAFNVLHETGFTPKELAMLVARLRNSIRHAAHCRAPQAFHCTCDANALWDDTEALAKYQPTNA
jgi:hypothetical protein